MKVEEALSGIDPISPILPVAHVTQFRVFDELVSQSLICLTSKCPRNDKPAAYFFYGAPYYKVPKKYPHELDYEYADSHVIGLLLSPKVMIDITSELYPFDTGAKAAGLYIPYLDKNSKDLTDYCVESKNATHEAGKLVRMFFGSNSAYIYGGPVDSRMIPMIKSACTDKVTKLHQAKLDADVRRRAIEIVALQEVPWNSEKFVLIGPERYLKKRRRESTALDHLLSDPTKATVIEYPEVYQFSPTSDSRIILDRAIGWLKKNRLI